MTHTTRVAALMAATLMGSSACGSSETSRKPAAGSATDSAAAALPAELRVSNVMIGRRIGAGNRVIEPTFEFTPQDTVYVSLATAGTEGTGTLTAAWRSQDGRILDQATLPVPSGGENTAFQLAQPKGLRPGTYKVVLFLGDDSVDTRVFVVKK